MLVWFWGGRRRVRQWSRGLPGCRWHPSVCNKIEIELDKFCLGLGDGKAGIEGVMGMLDYGCLRCCLGPELCFGEGGLGTPVWGRAVGP